MITYRKVTIDDLELLTQARVEFFADIHKDMTDKQKAEIYTQKKAYFEETMTDGTFTAWLAFDENTLIATSGINFYKTPPNPKNPTGKTAYISNMFTKPKYRGQGIATRLFTMTVEEAKNAVAVRLYCTRPIWDSLSMKNMGFSYQRVQWSFILIMKWREYNDRQRRKSA